MDREEEEKMKHCHETPILLSIQKWSIGNRHVQANVRIVFPLPCLWGTSSINSSVLVSVPYKSKLMTGMGWADMKDVQDERLYEKERNVLHWT